jgi:glycosyltransferase involved in cell wall biosynthesis
VTALRVVLLMWPDTFEDWYRHLGMDRAAYLDGYAGEWTITATAALRQAGADVHVVHCTLEEPGCAVQHPSGAATHFVPVSPAYRALRRAVWGHRWWEQAQRIWPVAPVASTLSARLLRAILTLRPDVVVIQDYECARFDVAAPLLRAAGVAVVGLDTGGSARPSPMPWKPLTVKAAHRLLTSYGAEAERVRRERGHDDVAVWPIPVRTDVYEPRDRAAARARLGLDPDVRIVASVGRLHPVKGLGDLADACRGLDADLVLVGSGSEEATLRSRGQPRLRLVGRRDLAELPDWYAAADVVALASRQEGQPVAVLEALACARGVVATAVGGVPEVVTDGEHGWLVPPRDVAALRGALAEALADRGEADRRGLAGREHVLARHAPHAAGAELLRLLRP